MGVRVRVRAGDVVSRLKWHHDMILDALAILQRIMDSPNPDPDDVLSLIRFVARFVDDCHHLAEERAIFSAANARGFPVEGGPISVMVCEHGITRYVARLAEDAYEAWRSGDKNALRDLIEYSKLLINHVAAHIEKENNILFPMLEAQLGEYETRVTVEDIEKATNADTWIDMVRKLKQKYGVE